MSKHTQQPHEPTRNHTQTHWPTITLRHMSKHTAQPHECIQVHKSAHIHTQVHSKRRSSPARGKKPMLTRTFKHPTSKLALFVEKFTVGDFSFFLLPTRRPILQLESSAEGSHVIAQTEQLRSTSAKRSSDNHALAKNVLHLHRSL